MVNIAKYCKDNNMTKDEYNNFKNNIVSTAKSIRSQLTYKGGMYYKVSDLFNCDVNSDMKCFIIQELKKLDIEFFKNDSLYRVCS